MIENEPFDTHIHFMFMCDIQGQPSVKDLKQANFDENTNGLS